MFLQVAKIKSGDVADRRHLYLYHNKFVRSCLHTLLDERKPVPTSVKRRYMKDLFIKTFNNQPNNKERILDDIKAT